MAEHYCIECGKPVFDGVNGDVDTKPLPWEPKPEPIAECWKCIAKAEYEAELGLLIDEN